MSWRICHGDGVMTPKLLETLAVRWGGWPDPLIAKTTTAVGAPLFAVFAKGGYHVCRNPRDFFRSYATRSRNEISPQSTFTFTGPVSPRR